MKRIDIAIQIGSVEDIEALRAHCAARGVRFCSLRAVLAVVGQFLLRVAARLTDVAVSLALLLTVFPVVYVVMATLIKRSSPGPAIVVEPALGAGGRRFGCFAFRLPADGGLSLVARSPRLLNLLLGHFSLFGPAPVPVPAEPEVTAEPEPEPVPAEPEVTAEPEPEPIPAEPEVTAEPEPATVELDLLPEEEPETAPVRTEPEPSIVGPES